MRSHSAGAGPRDARLKRLAAGIDALAEKDEKTLDRARTIAALRRSAAAGLYRVCADFVSALNGMLSRTEVVLDPPDYSEDSFQEDAPNLIQINARGRILQAEFRSAPGLLSTEDFRIPYALEGCVRAFNQALLDRDMVEEQPIFYTVEKHESLWRFFDARTYRSGPLDREYLISVMERLI